MSLSFRKRLISPRFDIPDPVELQTLDKNVCINSQFSLSDSDMKDFKDVKIASKNNLNPEGAELLSSQKPFNILTAATKA